MEKLGECYEEMGDKAKGMESYETAATWFESDGAKA